jgi:hypothetical protein
VVREIDSEHEAGAPFPPDTGIGLGHGTAGRGWLGWAHGGRTLPDTTNVGFGLDARGMPRAYAVDTRAGELLVLRAAARGVAAETLRLPELVGLGAAGVALDAAGDRLFVLEPAHGRIVVVEGVLGRARRRVSELALPANPPPLRGLAFDPATARLHALAPASGELLELDASGHLVAVRRLPLTASATASAIAIAPSTDRTDDPQRNHLFVAAPSDSGGITYELAFEPNVLAAVSTEPATLVQTILTSNFSPPSPDPSGIELLAPNGPLLISDGEVEEMGIYQGVNVWEVNLSGSVAATTNTLAFSDEPTGVAKNPSNGHFFFSDDGSGQYVYEVTPGSDGRVSPGDPVRSIRAGNYGVQDCEGVAFGGGALWIADGAGAEVYKILPGGNGTFDAGGDDVVTHFDTGSAGLSDVEGIAYDSDGGNLYVSSTDNLLGHFGPTGTLLRYLDVSAGSPSNPAGLAYGPDPAGSTTRRLYLVARGKDNNSDPNENDGKLFVYSVNPIGGGGTTNNPPTASAGPDLSIDLAASASLDGTVTDDGNPSGTLTTTWTKVSGPGTVTFANANAVDTTATFSLAGSYVVRLTANDGQLSASDDAAITVTTSGGGGDSVDVRVAAASDDAEQAPSGSVDTGSSDLELVADGSAIQTVGLRFANVAIPPGAAIESAWIQFMADETSSDATALTIQGEAADNAAPFTTGTNNVSARPRTAASLGWSPPAWNLVGEAGAAQRTPELAAVVQQIVSRGGWQSGNAMAFIVTGSGRRVAESFEGTAAGAALLHVQFGAAGGNLSPVVSAGPDQLISLGQTASLDGTVSDDAQPNPTPTTTWSKVSGPGNVGFANADAVDTTATFSAAGSYVLRLTAFDGALTSQDDMSVTVIDPNASGTIDLRVAVGADDVEQRVSNGSVSLTGGDLELAVDGTRAQLVGLRFPDLALPPGTTIHAAWIQFMADEVKIDPASLTIQGEKNANAAAFTSTGFNVSSRVRTSASVSWTPDPWPLVGQAGAAERTPSLAGIVQEIIDQPGWSPGNAIVFIVSGTGTRTAEPVEGGATKAPVLHVEYGP